jgi:hypothetical protein
MHKIITWLIISGKTLTGNNLVTGENKVETISAA